MREKIKR